jgi:uridine kinase
VTIAELTVDGSATIARMIADVGAGVIGVTGPAGAGKSTVGAALAGIGKCSIYSVDARFIGDSLERRALLSYKQGRSPGDYRDSANQFNWWDWESIDRDITALRAGSKVVIPAAYNRASGEKEANLVISPRSQILVEGALLGPPQIIQKIKAIIFLCVPANVRFERLLAKDTGRRSFNEIVARFLITEYSETIYYRQLFEWARDKMIFVDGVTGRRCNTFELATDLFIPLRTKADGQHE